MIVNNIRNRYGILDKAKLAWWLIRTKIISRKARIIRFPFTIRGGVYVFVNQGFTTGVGCRIEAFSCDEFTENQKILFGKNVQLNDYVHISAIQRVEIGDDVLMASHVYISDNSHGSYKGDCDDTSPEIAPAKRPYLVAPVKIGDRVWIGEGAIIMPGVTIGDGAVIGAHSIVVKDIPANSIAVGSPAIFIKKYSFKNKRWEKQI